VEVYRPLRRGDITSDLLGKEVHILWPDNGVWYRAILNEVRRDPTLLWLHLCAACSFVGE